MSLSRSPSPRPGGGWSSPGLTTGTGTGTGTASSRGSPSPRSANGINADGGAGGISWAAAKAKSDQVRGYPSFSTRNNGFFSRQRRKISASLPRFRVNAMLDSQAGSSTSSRPGRLASSPLLSRIVTLLGNLLRKTKIRLLFASIVVFVLWMILANPIVEAFRRSSWGSGSNIVLIVPTNIEGGVMLWKGPREWAIERNSMANKRHYANKWGYHFETPNMVSKKRYAHEWREGWEKVDFIRQAMRKHPNAEWFWWLDHNSYIMEPFISIEKQVLNKLARNTYRDINRYNPLKVVHPPNATYLDPLSLSLEGDEKPSSINLIVPQDCSGFNLGSFLIRRSAWTDRLLDLWWDPVHYEQRHMQWVHKEQDVLQHLYTTQPWIRPHVAFIPQRSINSFPPGACGKGGDPKHHYRQADRDFVLNLAGCDYGRDCWTELYHSRELSMYLNRTVWEKFKDGITAGFQKVMSMFRGKKNAAYNAHADGNANNEQTNPGWEFLNSF